MSRDMDELHRVRTEHLGFGALDYAEGLPTEGDEALAAGRSRTSTGRNPRHRLAPSGRQHRRPVRAAQPTGSARGRQSCRPRWGDLPRCDIAAPFGEDHGCETCCTRLPRLSQSGQVEIGAGNDPTQEFGHPARFLGEIDLSVLGDILNTVPRIADVVSGRICPEPGARGRRRRHRRNSAAAASRFRPARAWRARSVVADPDALRRQARPVRGAAAPRRARIGYYFSWGACCRPMSIAR